MSMDMDTARHDSGTATVSFFKNAPNLFDAVFAIGVAPPPPPPRNDSLKIAQNRVFTRINAQKTIKYPLEISPKQAQKTRAFVPFSAMPKQGVFR